MKVIATLVFSLFLLTGVGGFLSPLLRLFPYWISHGHWSEPPVDLLYGCLFLLVFGGFGFTGIHLVRYYSALNRPLPKPESHQAEPADPADQPKPPNLPNEPWVGKLEWMGPVVDSGIELRAGIWLRASWLVASVTVFALFIVIECLRMGANEAVLGFGFLLPAVTIYRASRRENRFLETNGPMDLHLDPYPGAIGGDVGGRILIRRSGRVVTSSMVELVCYDTSGEDRTKLWFESMVPRWTRSADLELEFCFEAPETVDEPADKRSRSWELNLEASFENGRSLRQSYDYLPVFKTGGRSSITHPEARSRCSTESRHERERAVDRAMPVVRESDGGYLIHYHAGRNVSWWFFVLIGLGVLSLGFSATGVPGWLVRGFGGIVFLVGCVLVGNSREVRLHPGDVRSAWRVFGLLVRERRLHPSEITEITTRKSFFGSSGDGERFDLIAVGENEESLVLVEGLLGIGEVRLAEARVREMLGNPSPGAAEAAQSINR